MPTTPPLSYPAISIVIPMYNTEKYVGACLTSILNQTFQNFEVIVVDDCSTDNSCAVVESFIPKFGGRLKLLHLEKNSGGPGIPSNKGVHFSRGKYVYVIDNDDLVMNNALEILYSFAENFNADVVSMDRFFYFEFNSEKMFPERDDLTLNTWQNDVVDKPTFETENIGERLKKFCQDKFGRPAWKRLIKRDLLIENDITFPNLKASADVVLTLQLIYYSKRFLKIPYPLYIYRKNMESITHSEKNYDVNISFWNGVNALCLKIVDKFLNEKPFFEENPIYRWYIMDYFNRVHFEQCMKSMFNVPPHELYDILKKIFEEKFGEYGDLIAYLCNSSNFSRLNLIATSQRIAYLENQLKELQLK